jgi:hypothetical protein
MVRGAGSLIVRRRHSGLDRSAAAGMALLPEYGGRRGSRQTNPRKQIAT